MSSFKYISVWVWGNPRANDGFTELLSIYNPTFSKPSNIISGGFESNPYFFALTIENTQVVYKLYKNNVRSYGAVRAGSLVIAFSVPRGYQFENGVGPYEVMMALKDRFLSACMTCRDQMTDTYEFNQGAIDQHVLDDIVKQYRVVPAEGLYCEMKPTGPQGYLELPEDRIKQFLDDVHYRELQDYSEVFIAQKVGGTTSFSRVPDLKIPRVPQFKIICDDKEVGMVDNLTQFLTFSSHAENRFFDNKSVTFTIQELLTPGMIPPQGVTIDAANEQIRVSTNGWEKPKTAKIYLAFSPNSYQERMKEQYRSMHLKHGQESFHINEDLTFTLVGKQIAYCDSPTDFQISCNGVDYKFQTLQLDGDQLRIQVKEKEKEEKQKTYIPNDKSKNAGGTTPPAYNPWPRVFELVLQFDEREDGILEGDDEQYMMVTAKNSSSRYPKFTNSVKFTKVQEQDRKGRGGNSYYRGVFLIPLEEESYSKLSYDIEFTTPEGEHYKTKNPVYLDKNERERTLQDYNFEPKKTNFFDKKVSMRWLAGLTALLLAAMIALGLSMALRSCDKPGQEEEKNKNETIIDEKIPDNSDQEEEIQSTDQPPTPEEAKAKVEEWKQTLQNYSVTFDKIESIYQEYLKYRDVYDNAADCKMINDYHDIKTWIINGYFDELKNAAKNNKQWDLDQKHKNALDFMTVRHENNTPFKTDEAKAAKQYFNEHHTEYKSFGNIVPPVAQSGNRDNGGGTGTSSGGTGTAGNGNTQKKPQSDLD